MSLTDSGNFLPGDETSFSQMVADVLSGARSGRPLSVKTVQRWTGAGERTVKNWFAGTCAPRGAHFQRIVTHSPEMLEAFLLSARRSDCVAMARAHHARRMLEQALAALDGLAYRPNDGDAPDRR